MCSVTWNFRRSGYELGFNRDEKWTRPVSAAPLFECGHPVPGACARDPAAGGTWLFTNQNGVTLAVMNAYTRGRIPVPGAISRGVLPLVAATRATSGQIEQLLVRADWSCHAPCELLLIDQDGVRHYCWDGGSFGLLPAPARGFLTTSSVRTEEVRQARNARYDLISTAPVSEILSDTTAEDPASAIFVTREDGGTVSQTLVRVASREIRFAVRRRGEASQEIVFPRRS